MDLLTIITPVYNRAGLISNLYKSLENQTNKDFCWLVVDDGSTDNTFEVVNRLKNNASFKIICIKQENGGKHAALNYGIRNIETALTMIVDSDDTLTNDAVQSIFDVHKKYSNRNDISMYTFLRGYSDGRKIVSIEKNEFVENYINYRIKNHKPGDMAEVFVTKYLKEHTFPVFDNEKFLSEDIVWIEIGKHSDSVYIDKVIYICEYQPSGLSANDKKMKFASPLGSMLRGKQLMSKECGIRANIRGAIIFNCYKIESKSNNIKSIRLSNREKILVGIFKIPGIYFNHKWKKSIGD
ncbi:hypothetical protein B5F29_01075 [Lachnoclostridium sp. An196]|uniref:glycosyltransferase family 2 protein n=1 Tax=Lachnoclostridium sp. An196 TaxID=1965583 RepID=UPI000B3981C7|nr:glycosyltransferase family 2 protein [Lachnoclostridium sp. An196]OUP22363.1 hypothetical protein B5F29_01075 [Lachnoclostridium sp. An196]